MAKEQTTTEKINQLALQEICPNTMEPITLYERNTVKKFKVFGYKVQALIAEEQAGLVEALKKIRDDFVPDKGQEQLALSEMRECAGKALEGR